MEQYFTWLSYVSMGLFAYVLAVVPLGILTRLSDKVVRFFCVSGISAALLVAVNSGIIYFWHHYYR